MDCSILSPIAMPNKEVNVKATLACFAFMAMIFASCNLMGQGCVAVRPMSCSSSTTFSDLGYASKGQWQIQTSYRYFESFRHFRGDEEETNRVEDGTQVINVSHAMDWSIGHMLTDRFGLSLNIPLINNDRTSLYEHYGNNTTRNPDQLRFGTKASGVGDIRLTSSYWLFDPTHEGRGNLQLGFGIKAPTGDSDVQDQFHRRDENGEDYTIVKAVDQSIQIGDQGWGYTLEVNSFLSVSPRTSLYFNGFYMFNPKNTNDTLTRGTSEGVNPLIVNHSVADQYAARMGANSSVLSRLGIMLGLGARIEGIPGHDLIGSSDGFRRPGYIVSVEPTISYMLGNVDLTLSVPVALYRNRTKSTYDLSDPTGNRHGDAAFADYLINLSFGYRFKPGK
jgi:hypothetical protein